MANKIFIGILTIVIFSTIFYVYGPGVRLRVDDDKSVLYTSPPGELRWVVVGTEYDKMFDGTTKMNRRPSDITREIFIDYSTNLTKIVRTTPYIRGPVIVHTWYFDGNLNRKDTVPISEMIEIYNGSGYIYQYEVRDLYYDGETMDAVTLSQQQNNPYKIFFDMDTKIEWDDKSYWSKVYMSGIFKARYRPDSDYELYEIRLYDPTQITACDSTDFTSADSYYMNGDISGSETTDCIKFTSAIATSWSLDCNSHTLTNTGDGRAIVLDGPDYGNIYDCVFEGRDEVISTLSGADDNYFHNVTAGFYNDDPGANSDLISLTGIAGDNIFTNITLDLAGCAGNADGIQDNDVRSVFTRITVLTTNANDVANAIKIGTKGSLIDTHIDTPVGTSCIQLGTDAKAYNVSVNSDCGRYGVKMDTGSDLYNSTISNITTYITGTGVEIYNNNITIGTSDIAFNISGTGHKIYNNIINVTINSLITNGTSNYFNTTKQSGTRILGTGRRIGGNVWYNSTHNYYTSCIDSNSDGWCDVKFYGIDYLALSDEYTFDNVTILNPINNTIYYDGSLDLNWYTNGDPSSCVYSINGSSNVTITTNITLSSLTNTTYNITISCDDDTTIVQSDYVYYNVSFGGTDNFTLNNTEFPNDWTYYSHLQFDLKGDGSNNYMYLQLKDDDGTIQLQDDSYFSLSDTSWKTVNISLIDSSNWDGSANLSMMNETKFIIYNNNSLTGDIFIDNLKIYNYTIPVDIFVGCEHNYSTAIDTNTTSTYMCNVTALSNQSIYLWIDYYDAIFGLDFDLNISSVNSS